MLSRLHGPSPACTSRKGHAHPRPTRLAYLRQISQPCLVASVQASRTQAQDADLQTLQAEYKLVKDLPYGQLTISALRYEWLERTGDLLAEAFVDAAGIHAYRTFVRRNIQIYLEEHIKLPPKACVLTAILRVKSSLPNSPEGTGATSSSTSSSSSRQLTIKAAAQQPARPGSSIQGANIPTTTSSSSSSSSDGPSSTSTSSSSSSTYTSSASNPLHPLASALQQLASLVLQPFVQPQQQDHAEEAWQEIIVGAAEVSFNPSTRTRNLTLNPPTKCAYLCNMAVTPDWRRQGIATLLLEAAEDLSRAMGEAEMYLHLRVQDEASAGSLYSKAGFQVHKKDCFLVKLLGQEQKYLLKKPLTTSGGSAGGGSGSELDQAAAAAQSKVPLGAVAAAPRATNAAVAVAAALALAMRQLITGL